MSEADKLAANIKRIIAGAQRAEIRLVECLSVDTADKTMDALGASDGVEYYGILLGLGSTFITPAKGSSCLIGIIDSQEVVTFLLAAEKVEKIETDAEEIIFNGGGNDGLVKVKELTGKLNTIEGSLNDLKRALSLWIPAPGDGGTALKTIITDWSADPIIETTQREIENKQITH